MNNNALQIFKKAQNKITSANEELLKPQNAIVSYAVCRYSRTAIKLLLESFLTKNKIPLNKKESIALLLERCALINKKFREIHLNKINCRHEIIDTSYCSDVNKVSSCFDVAKEIEQLVKNNF